MFLQILLEVCAIAQIDKQRFTLVLLHKREDSKSFLSVSYLAFWSMIEIVDLSEKSVTIISLKNLYLNNRI